MRILKLATLSVLALAAVGCSNENKRPPADASGAVSTAPAQQGAAAADVDRADSPSDVVVDRRITEMCGLPTPRFAFDRADIGPDARSTLKAIASCFESGPAKGKQMRLVGHADARGELHYNFALGQRRAGSVANYLLQSGLNKKRLETTSRGELDALGSDEEGWARDRRVDILLAE